MARRAARAASVAGLAACALLVLTLPPPPPPPPRVVIVYEPPPSNATAVTAVTAVCASLPASACSYVLSASVLAVIGAPGPRARAALAAAAPVASVEPDDAVVRRPATPDTHTARRLLADAGVRGDAALGARLGEAPYAALAAAAEAAAAADAPPPTPGPRPPALWGLARVSQRGRAGGEGGRGASLRYAPAARFSALGAGVTVYVLDSGVATAHDEFGGRAEAGPSFVDGDAAAADDASARDGGDCDGHGTHVASIAAGASVGVAPRARVVGVRVLTCDGEGKASAVARAVDWVVAQTVAADQKSVIVLSLGAVAADGGVAAMEAALEGAAGAGVVVAVAAGNGGGDACGQSPARVPSVLTVAASGGGEAWWGLDRRRATGGGALAAVAARPTPPAAAADPPYAFTAGGACVDLFAPGADILAACGGPPGSRCAAPSRPHALAWASGTSMAAPFVGGAAALLLAAGVEPAAVPSALVDAATEGGVDVGRLAAGTVGRGLYVGE